jgi:flagellar FliL protein
MIMSATEEPKDGEGDANAAKTAAAKKKKKLMIGGGAAAVLLLGGGGGGAYMMMGHAAPPTAKEKKAAEEKAKDEEVAAEEEEAGGEGEGEGGEGGHGAKKNAPLDVPPLLVNLHTADGTPHFLKLHIMLVPGPKGNSEALKDELPKLLDAYQPFLRELRPEDLSGSAAVYRIKEELLLRAGATLGHDKVKDVLVQDLIQQ